MIKQQKKKIIKERKKGKKHKKKGNDRTKEERKPWIKKLTNKQK